MLSNTDSANEHTNDIPIAITTNNINNRTLVAVGSATPSAANTGYGKDINNTIAITHNIDRWFASFLDTLFIRKAGCVVMRLRLVFE